MYATQKAFSKAHENSTSIAPKAVGSMVRRNGNGGRRPRHVFVLSITCLHSQDADGRYREWEVLMEKFINNVYVLYEPALKRSETTILGVWNSCHGDNVTEDRVE